MNLPQKLILFLLVQIAASSFGINVEAVHKKPSTAYKLIKFDDYSKLAKKFKLKYLREVGQFLNEIEKNQIKMGMSSSVAMREGFSSELFLLLFGQKSFADIGTTCVLCGQLIPATMIDGRYWCQSRPQDQCKTNPGSPSIKGRRCSWPGVEVCMDAVPTSSLSDRFLKQVISQMKSDPGFLDKIKTHRTEFDKQMTKIEDYCMRSIQADFSTPSSEAERGPNESPENFLTRRQAPTCNNLLININAIRASLPSETTAVPPSSPPSAVASANAEGGKPAASPLQALESAEPTGSAPPAPPPFSANALTPKNLAEDRDQIEALKVSCMGTCCQSGQINIGGRTIRMSQVDPAKVEGPDEALADFFRSGAGTTHQIDIASADENLVLFQNVSQAKMNRWCLTKSDKASGQLSAIAESCPLADNYVAPIRTNQGMSAQTSFHNGSGTIIIATLDKAYKHSKARMSQLIVGANNGRIFLEPSTYLVDAKTKLTSDTTTNTAAFLDQISSTPSIFFSDKCATEEKTAAPKPAAIESACLQNPFKFKNPDSTFPNTEFFIDPQCPREIVARSGNRTWTFGREQVGSKNAWTDYIQYADSSAGVSKRRISFDPSRVFERPGDKTLFEKDLRDNPFETFNLTDPASPSTVAAQIKYSADSKSISIRSVDLEGVEFPQQNIMVSQFGMPIIFKSGSEKKNLVMNFDEKSISGRTQINTQVDETVVGKNVFTTRSLINLAGPSDCKSRVSTSSNLDNIELKNMSNQELVMSHGCPVLRDRSPASSSSGHNRAR